MRYRAPLLILAMLLFPLSASASNEDAYHDGNNVGSSGWNIYSDFQEEEEETDEDRARREEFERLRLEEEELKKARSKDFFSMGVDVYDKGLSRTKLQEKALKSGK